MAIRGLTRYRSTTGLSTFEMINQRLEAFVPTASSQSTKSISPRRLMELEDQALRLSERHPNIFDLKPQAQLRTARQSLINRQAKQNALPGLSFSEKVGQIQIQADSESSTFDINELRNKFISAPYHEVQPSNDFLAWFDEIVNSLKELPSKLNVTYGNEKQHKFKITVKEWLEWLFSDNALSRSHRKALQLLEHNKLSEKLGLGAFNELRVAIALHSLKAAGVIKNFILSKKHGNDDRLGIDAVAIIHEYKIDGDKTGDTLSVPIQIKSSEGDPVYDFDTEASYPLSKSESKYMRDTKNLPDSYKMGSRLDVERTIPKINASGQSIMKLKEHIIELIKESFKRDKFLEFFGNFRNKSFVHKLKLLLEQGFMKVKTPQAL